MLKLNRLFYTTVVSDTFSDRIAPTPEQKRILNEARIAIREHLRPLISKATVTVLKMDKQVSPRFRTQGSWRYGLCLQQAWVSQELDWDYGIYLPVEVWEDNGPPHEMAPLYFNVVEGALKSFCASRGWDLIPGKNTCIRVKISKWAHFDIPLYAAPAQEFQFILEKAARAVSLRADSGTMTADSAAGELDEQEWSELDQIVLATRSGVWTASDPEAVCRWFEQLEAEFKDQFVRVCRYLKAWRDFQWKNGGGPSSLLFMIIAAQNFQSCPGRDDLALEAATRKLPQALLDPMYEPGIDDGIENFNKLDSDTAREASTKAAALAADLKRALALPAGSEAAAIAILTEQFGDRIPNLTHLIDTDGGGFVRSVAARTVSRPVVPATKGG
jgi:hypothetical protein